MWIIPSTISCLFRFLQLLSDSHVLVFTTRETLGEAKTSSRVTLQRDIPTTINAMGDALPAGAVGAFVGVLVYSLICLTLCTMVVGLLFSYGEKWTCEYTVFVHHLDQS